MTRDDDDLAPVTYLPGVHPSQRGRVASAPAPSDGPPTLRSVFGEMGDDVAQWADGAEDDEGVEAEDELPSDEDEARRAENVAMHALTRRGVSRRELERTLRARDLSEHIVEAELDRLEGVGLIDDVALAQNLVGTLQERKGLGRSAIAAELTRRLLAPSAIEYALELVDTGDELARARELARKRAPQLRSLDREVAVRRLSAYLARRGYSGTTVRTAVDSALPARSTGSGVRFQ